MGYKTIDALKPRSLKNNIGRPVKFNYDNFLNFSGPAIEEIKGTLKDIRKSKWPHRPYPVIMVDTPKGEREFYTKNILYEEIEVQRSEQK